MAMKKILKYLSLLLPLIVALGSIFMAMILAIVAYYESSIWAVVAIWFTGETRDREISDLISNMPVISEAYLETLTYVLPIIWIIIFYLWYRKLTEKEEVHKVKLFTFKNIILLILVGIGCQLVIEGLMDLILPYFEKLSKEYTELMEQAFGGNPVLVFISVVILAPFSEELIFRGVIFKKAIRFNSFVVANILQALLFGIFHMNIVQGIYAFGGGLAMGYVAYKYKTIMASILLHLFFNGLSYLMIVPTTKLMMLIYIVVGGVILIFALGKVKKVGVLQKYFGEVNVIKD
jgi:membrane protease YdiL (CAAX protease family)